MVPPAERRLEGPFGDHFGHYSHAAPFPVFHLKSMTRRRNAIYPAAVVGKPPQEDKFIGNALQEMTLPILRIMHPEVKDAWAYYETGFHSLLVVSVEERYRKEAIKTALGLLGTGQLSLTKCLITVGPDVPVRDFKAVLREVREHFKPEEDFILLPGTSYDTLDFTSFAMERGSKMILDATPDRKDGNPGASRRAETQGRSPSISRGLQNVHRSIRSSVVIENTLLAVSVEGEPREVLSALLALPAGEAPPIVAAVSPDVNLEDVESLLWGIFTRFEPARDVRFASSSIAGVRPSFSGRMVIDATWKNGYPHPVSMDPEVVRTVDQRWNEYWK
jgi:4-hydroxy-3-polyprenylbenzoate decarboxylase